MKEFIIAKLGEGRFSTPSEYIRSLIRDDQDVSGNSELALLIRRGGLMEKINQIDGEPVVMTDRPRR